MTGPQSAKTKTGTATPLLAVVGVVAAGFLVWSIIGPGRSKSGDNRAPDSKTISNQSSSGPADRKAPWKASRNDRVPQEGQESEASPVLDAWMEQNWEKDDAIVIDGLLGHAGRSDLGLAEKSRALEHALNLLPDPDYQKLDTLLAAPSTSTHLLQQVFTDLHNRSERASLHACLRLLARPEPEVAEAAKGFLAHWVDLDEESDTEAIRMQAETRLIELEEEQPPPDDHKEQDPKAPIPEGLRDTTIPAPEE